MSNYKKESKTKIEHSLMRIYLGIPLAFFISYAGGYYADKGLKELAKSQWASERRKKIENIENFANSINDKSKMKMINEFTVEVDNDLDSTVDGYIIHIPARPGGVIYVPKIK
jgi:hypothetical protein